MRDVQHQPRAHRVLQRALSNQRIPHAYLFAGPDGIGKEMMAIGFAGALLCPSPRQEPDGFLDACGECQECRLVQAGTHPDLQIIYRQLNRQHPDTTIRKQKALTLSVDVIRHFLIDHAGTYPARGRARIFVVREADRMNDAAQNSLLKTLEEPPRSTFIILLASALDKMLATTRSRCQQVLFSSLPRDFVVERLKALQPDSPADSLLYAGSRSGGSLGSALRQLNDGVFELKKPWGPRLVELTQPRRGFAPHAFAKAFDADAKILAKLVADRDPDVSDTDALRGGLQILLGALGDFYSDALRQATGAELPVINADQFNIVSSLAGQSQASLTHALTALAEADYNLSRNTSIELTLEALFISLANVSQKTVLI